MKEEKHHDTMQQLSTSPAPNACASCVELLDPAHIEKQQTIESWYSPCHFLRSVPETIMVDVVFEFLIANDFHSLVLTSFIKQFAILMLFAMLIKIYMNKYIEGRKLTSLANYCSIVSYAGIFVY